MDINNNQFENPTPNGTSLLKNMFKTDSKIKYPLLLILSIIPMTLLMILLSSIDVSSGTKWGASMGVFLIGVLIIAILRFRLKDQIKMDMYQIVIPTTWFFISWYAIPIGWWNLIVSVLIFILFYFVTTIVIIGSTIYRQKQKMDKMMQLMKEDPQKAQEQMNEMFKNMDPSFLNQFQNMNNLNNDKQNSNPNTNNFGRTLSELDEQLKKEGIDIEELDKQFGTFLDKEHQNNSIDDKLSDENLKNNSEQELILPPTPEDYLEQEELLEDDFDIDLENNSKIIDQ